MSAFRAILVGTLVCSAVADVWPIPSDTSKLSNATRAVQPSGAFFSLAKGCDSATLEKAFERYAGLAFPHVTKPDREATQSSITALQVSCQVHGWTGGEDIPGIDTDESYELALPDDGTTIKLSATTIYGVMRGLETFSQLVTFDFDSGVYNVPTGSISDQPRFPHRGGALRLLFPHKYIRNPLGGRVTGLMGDTFLSNM